MFAIPIRFQICSSLAGSWIELSPALSRCPHDTTAARPLAEDGPPIGWVVSCGDWLCSALPSVESLVAARRPLQSEWCASGLIALGLARDSEFPNAVDCAGWPLVGQRLALRDRQRGGSGSHDRAVHAWSDVTQPARVQHAGSSQSVCADRGRLRAGVDAALADGVACGEAVLVRCSVVPQRVWRPPHQPAA